LPKIARGTSKFDAHHPFAIFGGIHVDDAALLMFRRALVYQAKHLPLTDAAREGQKSAVRVHREHARGFAEGFAFTFEGDYFHRHNQPEAFAAAMRPAAWPHLKFRWIHEGRRVTSHGKGRQWYGRAE